MSVDDYFSKVYLYVNRYKYVIENYDGFYQLTELEKDMLLKSIEEVLDITQRNIVNVKENNNG